MPNYEQVKSNDHQSTVVVFVPVVAPPSAGAVSADSIAFVKLDVTFLVVCSYNYPIIS